MLRYEIDPSDLDVKNRDLIKVNREILADLLALIREHVSILEGSRSPKFDDGILQQRFRVLVAMALQYGPDAKDIADRLGVTVSTVHRWAKGTFVPPQVFIRAAAMRGIQALLQQELDSLDGSYDQAAVPERYVPHVSARYADVEKGSDESVVSFNLPKVSG